MRRHTVDFNWIPVLFAMVVDLLFSFPLFWILTKAGMPYPDMAALFVGLGLTIGAVLGWALR